MDTKEAKIILAELKRKAALVNWYNARRKERYGIIAKDIRDKEKLRIWAILFSILGIFAIEILFERL